MSEKPSQLRIVVDEDIHLTTSSKLQQLAGPQLLEEQRNGALVLDVRAPAQFVSFHIRGAIQIGLIGPFASWAAMLIAPAQRLVLVAEDIRRVHEAHTRLVRVGLKHVLGYSLADETRWLSEGMDVASISTRRCAAPGYPARRFFHTACRRSQPGGMADGTPARRYLCSTA